VVGLAVAIAGCYTVTPQPDLKGQDVSLTVIHTADLHSRIFPYQYAPGQIDKGLGLTPSHGNIAIVGGAARIATVVKQIRSESQRVIHIDSGDIFEGAPVFNLFTGEAEMRTWSRIGVTAMALGNHEFDKGSVNLELMKEKFGGFPILAANYEFSDPSDPTQPKLREVIQPFTVVVAQGLRIGIIGMGNLSSLTSIIEGGNSLGVRPLDTVQSLQTTVALLRPSVDLLIVLSHLGLDEDEAAAQTNQDATNLKPCTTDVDCGGSGTCSNNLCQGPVPDQNQQAAIDGVDVVFGGHLHIVLNPPKDLPRYDAAGTTMTGHTVLCHSGAFAKFVGRLDLVVHVADPAVPGDKNGVRSYTYNLYPIDDSIKDDPDMTNMLEPYQLALNTQLNLTQNYAVIPCDLTQSTCPKVTRSDPDGGDSQLGNLVAASMRRRNRVEADFGPLNLEEMYNVFPFDNTITTLYLSGDEIGRTLDFLAQKSGQRGCKSQAQVSGLWYLEDCVSGVSCGPYDAAGNRATHCAAQGDSSAAGGWRSPSPVDGPPLIGDQCIYDQATGMESMVDPARCRKLLPQSEFRAAVNDYIAAGGSGFTVLKNNTTKFNTGISLRDALIDYIRGLPANATYPNPQAACDPKLNSNIVYDGQDLTETRKLCDGYANPAMPTPDEQARTDMECGPGHRCVLDATLVGDVRTYCLRHYDYSQLPCLNFNIEAHDGRIGHSQ
jgi:5'-nucleotidase